MLGFAWLTIRQAQEALHKGRLEDAQRLLGQTEMQGHKRSWELLQQLAKGYVERGDRHLRHDNTEAAWSDLLLAEQLKVADCGTERLRQALTKLGVTQTRELLEAGEPERAVEGVSQLRQRLVRQSELDVVEEAAKNWLEAREEASLGRFAQALQTLERVSRLVSRPVGQLDRFRADLEKRQQFYAPLLVQLHEAAAGGQWREVVELSERVLALAPNHGEARKLRHRAWKAIEPATTSARPASEEQPEPPIETMPQRFLLWVDGVGGYLVCLAPRVTLGQATQDSYVDVPLFADVSRLHATLTRDAEGYLLEAVRPLLVNNEPATRTLLRPNDRVTLGSCCQVRFRQPAPVSASARLDMVSGHRLPLSVDGVLLMADTLVLGPGSHVHVELPESKNNVVLYRHKEGLGVRCGGDLSINGRRCRERGLLGPHATVTGDDFAFAVEAIGTRMGRT
jgi:hypothetical protein